VPSTARSLRSFQVAHLRADRLSAHVAGDSGPGPSAPFSSVTQWTWEEIACRAASSASPSVPPISSISICAAHRPAFHLAANIGEADPTRDRELLERHGWMSTTRIGHRVSCEYQRYIRESRAEFMCASPSTRHEDGLVSDRSIAYLASGRPVLAQETGFGERLPTGGPVDLSNLAEAVAGVPRSMATMPGTPGGEGARRAFFDSRNAFAPCFPPANLDRASDRATPSDRRTSTRISASWLPCCPCGQGHRGFGR